jgi:hypothetical protein
MPSLPNENAKNEGPQRSGKMNNDLYVKFDLLRKAEAHTTAQECDATAAK